MNSAASGLYDSLTGLVGRPLFHDRLAMAMARARRNTCSAILMLLDIDRFDVVTKRFGGDGGDQLLRVVASRLSATLRATDTIGRLGAEHFAILLEDVLVLDNTAAVANRVIGQFDDPFPIAGEALPVTASLGIASFPRCGTEADVLFNRAGRALGKAKARPGSAYEIDTPAPRA